MGFLGLGSAVALLGMRYGSAESVEFTERVSRELALSGWQTGLELAREKGAEIVNVDSTVIAEEPKIAPYVDAMKGKLSETLGTEADRVGIKATTNERMGSIGRAEGIAAMAVVSVELGA